LAMTSINAPWVLGMVMLMDQPSFLDKARPCFMA